MGMFDDFTDEDRGLLALSMAANMLGPYGGRTTGEAVGPVVTGYGNGRRVPALTVINWATGI